MESPYFKCSLKGDLLKKVTQRFPDIDPDAMEVMTILQSVDKSFAVFLSQALADHGLSEGKFYILMFLFLEDILGHESPSPSDIADNLGVTRATITGLLDGLERDGFIERRHHSVDRRALTILMTDKTKTLLNIFAPAQAANIKRLLSPLNHEEKRTLIRLLSKIDPQRRFPERP